MEHRRSQGRKSRRTFLPARPPRLLVRPSALPAVPRDSRASVGPADAQLCADHRQGAAGRRAQAEDRVGGSGLASSPAVAP
eukprot:66933-Rhodomonas_salina.1